MRRLTFLILALISFGISKAQTDSSLVLKKIGSSRTVEIEMGDKVKLKTADGEYHKGRYQKIEGNKVITNKDTLEIKEIEKVMANTKQIRSTSLIVITSGLAAAAASGYVMLYRTNDPTPSDSLEQEFGMNVGRVFLGIIGLSYSSYILAFGAMNYFSYNSYQVAGKRAKWKIIN